jgi:hypothetical protein
MFVVKVKAMNVTRLYWDMLIKDPLKGSEDIKKIFQNVQDDKIVGFNKKNGVEFLSNFHPSTIFFEKMSYPTVEHAYQASKTLDFSSRELIKKSKSPNDAKKLGRALILREDWDIVKLNIMRQLIREKFKNPFLRHLLINTEKFSLINENKWNDKFWGTCGGVGENWLGKILEEVRSEAITEDNMTFEHGE